MKCEGFRREELGEAVRPKQNPEMQLVMRKRHWSGIERDPLSNGEVVVNRLLCFMPFISMKARGLIRG
jgi:chromosome condensin MukBEF MukE localization factor